jgi:hypothetical protein
MAWRDWVYPVKPQVIQSLNADAAIVAAPNFAPAPDALAPARRALNAGSPSTIWQREVWDFYDSLGEFRQGVQWKANMLSRVRLVAARRRPGYEDPEVVTSGPAADLISELAGGLGGQSALMSSFSTYFDVPGECYLIGETLASGVNKWYVRAMEDIRQQLNASGYQVRDDIGRWRDLPDDSMVVRTWRPHRRNHNVADSPARPARTLMRELELLNRHIQAQYMSRLASAGVIIFPDEVSFPTRAEFADEPDPFVAEWIEIAAEAIRTPGTAAAVVPIPIKVPGEYVDKVRHIDFTLRLDDSIVEKRDSALTRLAISLDMPPEALLGTKGVNHWSAWLIDEQGVKIHIAPTAELICDALTTGYMAPRREAQDDDPNDWMVWYDASDLILRPDRSQDATDTYDRLELSGEALRREHGFDESDKPSEEELREIILKKASLQPVNTFAAMDELGLNTSHDTPPAEPRPDEQPAEMQDKPLDGPPDSPPLQPEKATVDKVQLTRILTHQAELTHALKITVRGTDVSTEVFHPKDCSDHLFSCPVTHALWKPQLGALPGRQGIYQCWLNAHGQPIIGDRMSVDVTRDMISSTAVRSFNGASH